MSGAATFSHPSFAGWIGAARREITPPVGIYSRCWGAALHDTAEGIHRPLTLTALVISDAARTKTVCLIGVDLCAWGGPRVEAQFRSGVAKALGVDASAVMINLAHTHSGGPLYLSDENRDVPGGHLIKGFYEMVSAAAVAAAEEASVNRREAVLTWAEGHCDLAANRDLRDPDPARERYICGFNPAARADDTVLVGRACDTSGKIIATIVNYACHPTTLAWQNRLISPDYPGAMRELVEGAAGGAPCLFLQGASGELAPREQYSGDTALADRHGRRLGHAALAALEGMLPGGMDLVFDGVIESGTPLAQWAYAPARVDGTLRSAVRRIELPLKKELPAVDEVERALASTQDRVMTERLRRQLVVRDWIGRGKNAEINLWAWRLGDALLFGAPVEAYSGWQTALRQHFKGRAVAVMNLVNGCIAYVCPAEIYGREIYQLRQSPFDAGSLEKLIEASIAMGDSLLAGA